MSEFIALILRSKFFGGIFHTLDYCLARELKDCRKILDLGCGPSSPLRHCANIEYSIGVDAFEPYLETSKKKKIHTKYLNRRLEDLDFAPGSFDAVIMIEVIEHLNNETALKLLEKAHAWAAQKVIISTPNGLVEQTSVDGNDFQRHLSGWDHEKISVLGYKCRGLSGMKIFRKNAYSGNTSGDMFDTIRFRPKLLWFAAAALSQIFAYWDPGRAYGLFCVRKKQQ